MQKATNAFENLDENAREQTTLKTKDRGHANFKCGVRGTGCQEVDYSELVSCDNCVYARFSQELCFIFSVQ